MKSNQQNHLISIIIPIYNVEDYIDKCISSIVSQTYRNIEVLLIDDGSTDLSGNICKQWSIKDNRVKYYYKINGGVCSARNKGIEEANGEYIGFVDADDWIDPTMYEHLYSLLTKYHCTLSICGRIRVIDDKCYEYPQTGIHYFPDGKIEMKDLSCPYDLNISVNKLYHKSIFKQLRFPTNMTYAEDLYIVPDILSQAKGIVYTSKGLYYYLERNNSASFSFNEAKAWDDLEAKTKFLDYLKNKKAYSKIAFDWLFGAYARGFVYIKNKGKLSSKYRSFFRMNFSNCAFSFKCILFLLSPKLYYLIKNHAKHSSTTYRTQP